MTVEELEQFIESHGVHIVYLPSMEHNGQYCRTLNTIFVNARLHSLPKNVISTLAHEYAHHLLGHDGPQPACEEERADRLAAQMLITPAEYALAERLHEGNAVGLAEELGVPIWVVKAYREALCCESHRYRVGVFI